MALDLTFDISEILNSLEKAPENLEKVVSESAAALSAQTHLHIVEQAQAKLGSRAKTYVDNLKIEQIENNIWTITVPHESLWIEDGIKSGTDMLNWFMGSPKAKQGKNGKFLVIPFKHNKGGMQSAAQKPLTDFIKKELTKRKIGISKIEKHPDGSPKLGLLHKFNFHGPHQIGKVAPPNQGPQGRATATESRPHGRSGPSGRPFLWGLSVYQREVEVGGRKIVKKDILTFRTASESQKGRKWIHPGSPPANLLDEAYEWASREWEMRILPELMETIGF